MPELLSMTSSFEETHAVDLTLLLALNKVNFACKFNLDDHHLALIEFISAPCIVQPDGQASSNCCEQSNSGSCTTCLGGFYLSGDTCVPCASDNSEYSLDDNQLSACLKCSVSGL